MVLWQHSVLTTTTFRCWGGFKFLGLEQETNMASHALLSRQWTVPMALSRCRDIQGMFLSAVCPLAPARSHHHGNTGRKRKNSKAWREAGRGGKAEKTDSHLSNTSEQGEQVTNGLRTNCHAVSHRERISFPTGNTARSLISWQLRNNELGRGLQAV